MLLFGGMQQDFETTLNEFLAKVKAHVDHQNATLAEYERFFSRAQELFPAYSGFVQHVNDALNSIHESVGEGESSKIPTQKKPHSAPKFESLGKLEKKKILIVDDAEINRVLMGHFFKHVPTLLEFASSGEQALTKISQHTFDLILMDLQMKGMSGVDAIKAIRGAQSENAKHTQIVAITNLEPTEEERIETMNAGANEYLSKSMPREAIKERVFEFLFGANQISA